MPNYVLNKISLLGPEDEIKKALNILRSKENETEIDFNNVIKMPESLRIPASSLAEDFMAAYLKTLSDKEKLSIAEKLSAIPVRYDGNYLKKYQDAFINGVDDKRRRILEDTLKRDNDEYKATNLTSIEDVGKAYIDNMINYGADTWYDWCVTHWGTKWGPSTIDFDDDYISFDTAWSAPVPVFVKLSEMVPEVSFSHEYADEDVAGNNCGRIEYKAGEIAEEFYPEGKAATKFACEIWGYDYSEYLAITGQNSIEPMTLEALLEPYNIGLKLEGDTIVLQDFGKPGSDYDGLKFEITGNEISEIITAVDALLKEDYDQFISDVKARGIDTEGIFLEDLIDLAPTDVNNYGLFYNIVYCNGMMSIEALEKKSVDKVISEAKEKGESVEPKSIEKDDIKEL